jgi:hypothetical protein
LVRLLHVRFAGPERHSPAIEPANDTTPEYHRISMFLLSCRPSKGLLDIRSMSKSFLTLIAVAASLIGSNPIIAQQIPGNQRARSVQIIVGPAVESATERSAIIRWMSTTPAGPAEHFGVVHYGTDPEDLSQMAESPMRLNMAHPNTIFRVRVDGLMPGTTYYYTVDSTGPDGNSDGVKGTVSQFTTRQVERSK